MNGLPALTDPTRHTLALARTTAGRARSTSIDPEHVLVALLLAPTCDAFAVLLRAGVAAEQLDALPRRMLPSLSVGAVGIGSSIPYASTTKQVIIAAPSEARLDRKDAASPRHLLRALLLSTSGHAARELSALGIDIDSLRRASTDDEAV
jgi:ATP-dependent Clp protease ATP-binding subunit ClpA